MTDTKPLGQWATEIIAERDALKEQVARLTEALECMVAEQVDYMTINKLGDPEKQHSVKAARAALSATPPQETTP